MSARAAGGAPAPVLAEEAERIRQVYGRRRRDGRYGWDQPGQQFMMLELERRLLAELTRAGLLPLGSRRVLEIGCGTGHFLRELVRWGADPARMVGIDLIEERLERARQLSPAVMRFEQRDAADTGFETGSFDLVLQFTVFTSILSAPVRRAVAQELRRLVAPGGAIIWYDFRVNNPANPDVRAVGKAELRSLFPRAAIRLRTSTLAPPLARRLAPHARWLCAGLASVPWLRTHYLAVIRPEPS